jgi:hypothetical protein
VTTRYVYVGNDPFNIGMCIRVASPGEEVPVDPPRPNQTSTPSLCGRVPAGTEWVRADGPKLGDPFRARRINTRIGEMGNCRECYDIWLSLVLH